MSEPENSSRNDDQIKIITYNGPLVNKLQSSYNNGNPCGYSERVQAGKKKLVLATNYVNSAQKYRDFQSKSSDVWVISYPKAGTTWTQEMVWCILNNLEDEKAKEILMKRFPFFEWDGLLSVTDQDCFSTLDDDDPCKPGVTWELLHTESGRRTIKSHLITELLPKDLFIVKPKIVYICRDPKDVCVSYYYHSKKLDAFTGSFDNYFDVFVNDIAFHSPFWANVLDFWDKRNYENVLFIRFEDLKQDLPGMIKKVSAFLEKDISEVYLSQLVNHLSFESMRLNRAVNNEAIVSVGDTKSETIKFMRKGQVGDWRNHLNAEQEQIIKKWTGENLKDSDFPYYRD